MAITYIITAREIGFNASFYGVRFYSSTAPGVVMLTGIILIMLTMLMDLGQLLNSVIQILEIILIYTFTFNTNYNFESSLWGIAATIILAFNLIPFFYRGNYTSMTLALGYSSAILIFTIGLIITGSSQISIPSPTPNSILFAVYFILITAGSIAILTGIIGILDAIFILVYALIMKSLPPM